MDVGNVQEMLRQRAFLHDDPDAYLAGVVDALAVVNDADEPVEPEAQELFGT